jgi:dTDP-4-amino-4,6-dideoxygalactose transaminase
VNVPILDLKPAYAELREQLDDAYRRVMESGWVLLGKELEAFEAEYATSVGAKHCIGVANGLEALQLVLMARGIGAGDEVIVPAHGYIATFLAVTHAGATPVPVECDERTYNLDPARIAAALTPRTKAILPIHLYGQPADMAAINALARQHGLFVLEDAAQSHGAGIKAERLKGGKAGSNSAAHQGSSQPFSLSALQPFRPAGALGDAAGISFYPSKNLGALADAGAITTSDDALADKLRHLRNYGSKVRYQHEYLGMNSRLEELQAAFLRVKLPRLPEWNARRAALAERYLAQLRGVGDLVLPFVPEWAQPVWHLFVVRTAQRAALQSHLAAAGIGTQIHYPTPPHLTPAYRHTSRGWQPGAFPLAEKLAGEVLSLPIGPHHTVEQIDYVCASIRDFFARSAGFRPAVGPA